MAKVKIDGEEYLLIPIGKDELMSLTGVSGFLKYVNINFRKRHPELVPEPDPNAEGFKKYRKSDVIINFLKYNTELFKDIDNDAMKGIKGEEYENN